MRYIYYTGLALLLVSLCAPSATEAAVDPVSPAQQARQIHPDTVPEDSGETSRYWNMARNYKKQMRYEMARQYYLLALAGCRSDVSVQRIQRELQIVELQIRSLR